MTDFLALLYFFGCLIAAVFLIVLFLAPIKLYAIHRELVKLNAEVHIQTRLLASLANEEPASMSAEEDE